MDFSNYKENTLVRRMERRVSINQFHNLEEYLNYLSGSDQEKETLFKELLIGVTGFFRDAEAFDFIAKNVIPKMKAVNQTIRIWSVACSTGEEVYSIAMLLNEYLESNHLDYEIKIFATDIDRNALAVASQGNLLRKCCHGYRSLPVEKIHLQNRIAVIVLMQIYVR